MLQMNELNVAKDNNHLSENVKICVTLMKYNLVEHNMILHNNVTLYGDICDYGVTVILNGDICNHDTNRYDNNSSVDETKAE